MSATTNFNLVLDLYQHLRSNGEWASLFMETKNGQDTITLKIGNHPAGSSADAWTPQAKTSRKGKTPSQQRRDQKRKSEFLAKKNLEVATNEPSLSDTEQVKASSDPVKAVLVEPKDEIVPDLPEVKEVEKVVNYVGEYVYDTKLYNDEIHKSIWKTLQATFKEGVEEFFDGSTCNEKILMFWGKCKFKEGFNRGFILDKKNWPKEIKKIEIEDPG